MFARFKELKVDFVFCENLNSKAGTWDNVLAVIKSKYPSLAQEYQRIFFTKKPIREFIKILLTHLPVFLLRQIV